MSRTKLLLQVAQDVQALGASLQELCLAMQSEKPKVKEEKTTKQSVTLEEVRGVLARKSQEGFTAQIKSIIQRFDAEKLSDVNPQDYEEIMLLAEELSHD
ncbi:hypothetical protein SAMN02745116_01905 [Pilibacter termitis]|uniref:rRNA biogenesis protein rrp5 n=1 Tax=Pilibacter termitis TaxID=263852 RepID=A0A1T4PSK3_9ENTE|nr:hypothetical protein [Pilibacter termitis]SJZ94251.1 hypothetical protein SAMN02745116_01905 [Pilibacter termitis]